MRFPPHACVPAADPQWLFFAQRLRVRDASVKFRQKGAAENENVPREFFPFRGDVQARENVASIAGRNGTFFRGELRFESDGFRDADGGVGVVSPGPKKHRGFSMRNRRNFANAVLQIRSQKFFEGIVRDADIRRGN